MTISMKCILYEIYQTKEAVIKVLETPFLLPENTSYIHLQVLFLNIATRCLSN